MDKQLCKLIAEYNGIKVAKGQVMTAGEYLAAKEKFAQTPHVVKPVSDGSSVGVFVVKKAEDTAKVAYNDLSLPVMVEDYVAGRELTVMCWEGKSSVVTELKSVNQFYDYEAKYTSGKTQHILPADLPAEVTQTCLKYAQIMHKALGCNVVSRCDFRYNPNDGVVFLEINTNPGMTALSLVPEQAKYLGISFADLCAQLVEKATCRRR